MNLNLKPQTKGFITVVALLLCIFLCFSMTSNGITITSNVSKETNIQHSVKLSAKQKLDDNVLALTLCLREVHLIVKHPKIIYTNTHIYINVDTVMNLTNCPSPSYLFTVTQNGVKTIIQNWGEKVNVNYTTPNNATTIKFNVTGGEPNIPLTSVSSPTFYVVNPTLIPTPTLISTPTSSPVQTTFVVPNVPHFYQTNTSEYCEAASLAMALWHEGIDVSITSVIAHENVQYPSSVYSSHGQVVSNGDPYTSFVGNPYGTGNTPSTYGYGTYYPNLVRDATALGGHVLWAGTGLSLEQMYVDIEAGHPVVAWVDDNKSCVLMNGDPLFMVTAADGRNIPYATYGYEHVLIVVGVNANSIEIYNPLPCGFSGWISKSAFANTFATFNNMALVMN